MKHSLNNGYVSVAVIALLTAVHSASAMPAADHNRLAQIIQDTPVDKGGLGGMPDERINAIRSWIDQPATQTGKFINHVTGTLIHPTNHGHLHHDPENVARVFSGDGSIDLASYNLACAHKIQDVAHNNAGVDGYPKTFILSKRQEAQALCGDIEKNKGLLYQMPSWVKSSGPLRNPSEFCELESLAGTSSGLSIADKMMGSAGAVGAGIDGGIDLYHGIKNRDAEKTTVGSVKSAAAITMGVGTATVQPEVVVAGGIVYGGAVVSDVAYKNREAIARTANNGAAFTERETKAGIVAAQNFAVNHTSKETQNILVNRSPESIRKMYVALSNWAQPVNN